MPDAAPLGAGATLRIATWNLRSGISVDRRSFWWWRRRRVAAVLAAVDADVWAFQEVFAFQRRWLLRGGLPAGPWGHAGRARGRCVWGEAVPVLWPEGRIRAGQPTTFWLGPDPTRAGSVAPGASAARVATAVDLSVVGGPAVRVVNTHFDHRSARARRDAAAQLAGWLADRPDDLPVVVTGDLNAGPDDEELGPLLGAGLTSALPPEAGATATAFETEEGRRLDHVLVSRHWEVVAAEVVHAAGRASDHYPVVADLRLRPGLG